MEALLALLLLSFSFAFTFIALLQMVRRQEGHPAIPARTNLDLAVPKGVIILRETWPG